MPSRFRQSLAAARIPAVPHRYVPSASCQRPIVSGGESLPTPPALMLLAALPQPLDADFEETASFVTHLLEAGRAAYSSSCSVFWTEWANETEAASAADVLQS